jgi:hypothetical protein
MKTIQIRTTIQSFFVCSLFPLASLTINVQGLRLVQLTNLKAESGNGDVNLSWKTSSEENLRQFEIEFSNDGRYYHNLDFIPATNSINGNFYEFEYPVSYNDSAFFRLKIIDNNGSWLYSDPVLYHINKLTPFFVNPSVINTHIINIFLNDPFYSLKVVSMNGTVMLKQNLSGITGRIKIPISQSVSPGIYVVQLKNYTRTISQEIFIQ